jgi:hypothetical protein
MNETPRPAPGRIPRRTLVILCFAVALICLTAIAFVPVSSVFSAQARLDKAPPTDDRLIEWLKAQPNVVPHTVHVVRRENQILEISFIQVRHAGGWPKVPDYEAACNSFGYRVAAWKSRRCQSPHMGAAIIASEGAACARQLQLAKHRLRSQWGWSTRMGSKRPRIVNRHWR